MSGLDLFDQILLRDPAVNFILTIAYYSTDSAVDAIRRGAHDYLPKPLDVVRLQQSIRDLEKQEQERRHALNLDHDLVDTFQFEGMIGRSPLMLDLFGQIRRIASHFRSVLVTGSTGTGKELVAKALHTLSARWFSFRSLPLLRDR